MATATRDRDASARLWSAIQRELTSRGDRPSKTRIAEASGVSRPTLDNWLVHGVQPPADGMRRIADALGVDYTRLWLAWLDIPLPDATLVRIAEALERAFPKDSDPEDEAAEVSRRAAERAQASTRSSRPRSARGRASA